MTNQLPAQQAREKRAHNHQQNEVGEVEDDGTPKKRKVDLEDGPRKMDREPEPYAIESTILNGSFLKAKYHRNSIKLEVDFNGTDFDDPSTVFQIGRDDERKANFLRYSKNDEKFYLAVKKDGEVHLRKLLHPPASDKYFFCIKKASRGHKSLVTFKSFKSGEYLHCSSDTGRVYMKTRSGKKQPTDRETWFTLLPRRQQKEQLLQINQDQLDGMESVCEDFLLWENEDSEDDDSDSTGKGYLLKEPGEACSKNSEKLIDADKSNTEYPLESSEILHTNNNNGEPKEENLEEFKDADQTVMHEHQDSGKANSKDLEKNELVVEPPHDQGKANLEDPEKKN